MKKIFLILSVILLVVGLSACGAAKKAGNQPAGESFSGSMMDLIKLGKSTKCVLTTKGETISTATTYISGTKARSDYETAVPNSQPVAGHFISDGTWMYTWSDSNLSPAVKFKLDEMPKADTTTQNGSVSTGDLENKMDYQCYPWAADQSVFTPPANINFTDYSQLLKQFQGLNVNAPASGDNSALCGQCNLISNASAKASCKKSLGCK